MVSTVVSQQEGSWFKAQQGSFCVELACSPCPCVGFLQVLQLPPTEMHVRLAGGSKLSVGVIVSVHVVYMWPCDGLVTCHKW